MAEENQSIEALDETLEAEAEIAVEDVQEVETLEELFPEAEEDVLNAVDEDEAEVDELTEEAELEDEALEAELEEAAELDAVDEAAELQLEEAEEEV